MKIKSNLPFSTKLSARHTRKAKAGQQIVIGSALPEQLNIPAGSTITLDDAEWPKFALAAKPFLKNKHLEMTKAPAMSEEDQAEADAQALAEAQAVVASLTPKKEDKK